MPFYTVKTSWSRAANRISMGDPYDQSVENAIVSRPHADGFLVMRSGGGFVVTEVEILVAQSEIIPDAKTKVKEMPNESGRTGRSGTGKEETGATAEKPKPKPSKGRSNAGKGKGGRSKTR